MQTTQSSPTFRPVTQPPIFDTLVYARRMEEVGFTRQQAERLAEEQAKLIDERLATKSDIAEINVSIEQQRLQLSSEVDRLRLQVKGDIETSADKTKLQMVLWFLGISAAQLATLADLIKFHL